ncbi:MAG TPA: putative metallopeptidase [Pyrinomonadaceae bacterium]|jgi:hypothetical protein
MSITYSPAKNPEAIARKVISEFYPDLTRVDFVFLFKIKKDKDGVPVIPVRKGKDVWFEVKLISGLNAYLSSERITGNGEEEPRPYFVISLTQIVWDHHLDEAQREALMDTALCLCDYDSEKDKLSVRGYDVEAHHEVMKRRGAWAPELETFVKVAQQRPLPGVAPATKEASGRIKRAAAGSPATPPAQ